MQSACLSCLLPGELKKSFQYGSGYACMRCMRKHQRSDWKAHKVERRRIFAASGEKRAAGGGADGKPKLTQAHGRPRTLRPTTLGLLNAILVVLTRADPTTHARSPSHLRVLQTDLTLVEDRIIVDGKPAPIRVRFPAGIRTHDGGGEWTPQATELIRAEATLFCAQHKLPGGTRCAASIVDKIQDVDIAKGDRWADPSIAGDLNDPKDDTHRGRVGGNFEDGGAAQLAIMVRDGLQPHHRVADIGCGSLRAGVKVVPFLNPGHYYGIDINEALLDAGYQKEVVPRGLASRLPRSNLAKTSTFDLSSFRVTGGGDDNEGSHESSRHGGEDVTTRSNDRRSSGGDFPVDTRDITSGTRGDGGVHGEDDDAHHDGKRSGALVYFDFAMIQSVFTHVSLDSIDLCLASVARHLRPGGTAYATYNALPEHADRYKPFPSSGTLFHFTHHDKDEYHYKFSDFVPVAARHGLEAVYVGSWGHEMERFDSDDFPSMNRLVKFIRKAAPGRTASQTSEIVHELLARSAVPSGGRLFSVSRRGDRGGEGEKGGKGESRGAGGAGGGGGGASSGGSSSSGGGGGGVSGAVEGGGAEADAGARATEANREDIEKKRPPSMFYGGRGGSDSDNLIGVVARLPPMGYGHLKGTAAAAAAMSEDNLAPGDARSQMQQQQRQQPVERGRRRRHENPAERTLIEGEVSMTLSATATPATPLTRGVAPTRTKQKKHVLMIIAHPDDEFIFGGEQLLASELRNRTLCPLGAEDCQWEIVVVSNGTLGANAHDGRRMREFEWAVQHYSEVYSTVVAASCLHLNQVSPHAV